LSYIFTLGFLISYLAIKIRSQKDSKEEQKIKFRNVKKTFLVYYAVCAAGMIILLFNSAPPAPFATKASILDGCHGSADCRESFLSYELKNCDGQTSFFLYPLKTSSLKADQCMFDNFILQKPLKDIPKYSNVDPGNVDVAIKFFDDQLKVSTDKKKSDFCKSFSDSVYVEKSNQVYCFISLEMVDDWTSETLKSVCTLVLTEYDWKDGYIKDICINKILDFDVYFIDDTLLNNLFGIKKWSYRMYGPRFGDHTGEFIYRVSLRTDVALEGNSDDFMIMQSSVSGGLYQHFLQSISTTNFDFRYNDYLNNNNNYDILTNVTNTRKIKINDVDVYIQDIEEIRDNKVLREYINLNFVKGNTYVLIDGQRYGENNRNDVFIKIAEAIIKQ
jgi:hypothetical protein